MNWSLNLITFKYFKIAFFCNILLRLDSVSHGALHGSYVCVFTIVLKQLQLKYYLVKYYGSFVIRFHINRTLIMLIVLLFNLSLIRPSILLSKHWRIHSTLRNTMMFCFSFSYINRLQMRTSGILITLPIKLHLAR